MPVAFHNATRALLCDMQKRTCGAWQQPLICVFIVSCSSSPSADIAPIRNASIGLQRRLPFAEIINEQSFVLQSAKRKAEANLLICLFTALSSFRCTCPTNLTRFVTCRAAVFSLEALTQLARRTLRQSLAPPTLALAKEVRQGPLEQG